MTLLGSASVGAHKMYTYNNIMYTIRDGNFIS